MKNLILIGAGAWGLEVWSWLEESNGYGKGFTFKGFIDNYQNALDDKDYCSAKVINSIDDYEIDGNDVFVCTIGDPIIKSELVLNFITKGAVFLNLIHSSAIFFKGVQLGTGIVVSPNCVISNNSKINNHVAINLCSTIGHDTSIGDFSVVSSHCDITGNVTLGKNVYLGSRVSIIPGKKICDNVIIGAGSVVFKNIRRTGTYIGNPAKYIGE